jgi:triacylglycerol lipase
LLAYEDETIGEQTAKEWGFNKFKPFSRNPHFGIVMGNDRMILIAFRGTNERADWWSNLDILFRRSPLGWVHRGFLKATELFWPELPKKISEFYDNNQTIWITGHSLGGALALLASIKLLIENKFKISGVYTFGQPPVGTLGFCSKFKEHFPNNLFRFVNHTDAVSGLPILFRAHVGEIRYFDTSGSLWDGKPPGKVSFLDHIQAPSKFGGLSQFTAHPMKNYVELIEKQISEKNN